MVKLVIIVTLRTGQSSVIVIRNKISERYYQGRIFLAFNCHPQQTGGSAIDEGSAWSSSFDCLRQQNVSAIIGQDLLSDCLRNKIWALL